MPRSTTAERFLGTSGVGDSTTLRCQLGSQCFLCSWGVLHTLLPCLVRSHGATRLKAAHPPHCLGSAAGAFCLLPWLLLQQTSALLRMLILQTSRWSAHRASLSSAHTAHLLHSKQRSSVHHCVRNIPRSFQSSSATRCCGCFFPSFCQFCISLSECGFGAHCITFWPVSSLGPGTLWHPFLFLAISNLILNEAEQGTRLSPDLHQQLWHLLCVCCSCFASGVDLALENARIYSRFSVTLP